MALLLLQLFPIAADHLFLLVKPIEEVFSDSDKARMSKKIEDDATAVLTLMMSAGATRKASKSAGSGGTKKVSAGACGVSSASA
jgi:hypothetical protein